MARAAPNYSWLYYIIIINIMANLICFIYCFGRLSANKHPIRYTCHTTHKHTYGWQSQPPPRSCTCLGPRESGKVRKQIRRRELEGEHARPKHYRYATFLLLLRCQRAAPSSPRCPRLEGLSAKPQLQVGRRKRAPPNAYRIFLA